MLCVGHFDFLIQMNEPGNTLGILDGTRTGT